MKASLGVRDALQALFREEEWLYSLARQLVQDDAAARDLVQDTWVAALENPPRNTDQPRKWLLTVASRLARKRRSRLSPEYVDNIERLSAREERPDYAALRWEAMQALRGAVGSLEEPNRETVLLIHQEELSQEEAGRSLGISTRAVRFRLSASYRKIKLRLGGEKGMRDGSWALCITPLLGRQAWRTTAVTGGSGAILGALIAVSVLAVGATSVALINRGSEDGSSIAAADGIVPEGERLARLPSGPSRGLVEEKRLGTLDLTPPKERTDPPSSTDQEKQTESLAIFSVHGRIDIDGSVPDEFLATLLPDGFAYRKGGPISEQTMLVREDGSFDLGAREEGHWSLLIRPPVRPSGSGYPTYSIRIDFPSAAGKPEVAVEVGGTTTLAVLTEEHEQVWLWTRAGATPWEYKSMSTVEDGKAVFTSVPVGPIEVRYRHDMDLVDYNDFKLLWTGWVEADGVNVIDLRR